MHSHSSTKKCRHSQIYILCLWHTPRSLGFQVMYVWGPCHKCIPTHPQQREVLTHTFLRHTRLVVIPTSPHPGRYVNELRMKTLTNHGTVLLGVAWFLHSRGITVVGTIQHQFSQTPWRLCCVNIFVRDFHWRGARSLRWREVGGISSCSNTSSPSCE